MVRGILSGLRRIKQIIRKQKMKIKQMIEQMKIAEKDLSKKGNPIKKEDRFSVGERGIALLLVSVGILVAFQQVVINAEQRGAETAVVHEVQASVMVEETAISPWYEAWNDLQGEPIREEWLLRIDQNWQAYVESGCDPYWMAAIHFRETTFDVGNNNPFQLPNHLVSQDTSSEGLKEDAREACTFLKNKKGGGLPAITQETIGLWADASWKYNGTAYGSWEDSPYVVNNLDSSKIGMIQCAVDGCGALNTSENDGVMTFYLKLLRR